MADLASWTHAIDAAHAADPAQETGRPAELLYAERMSAALNTLEPSASAALQLAARAQHLERWTRPRAAFPEGRAGYLAWRREASRAHAQRVTEILDGHGAPPELSARVADLITKKGARDDQEAQVLEDAACLVFLTHYFDAFAVQHEENKVIDIVRKTWRKMSERGRQAAGALALSERAAILVARATS